LKAQCLPRLFRSKTWRVKLQKVLQLKIHLAMY